MGPHDPARKPDLAEMSPSYQPAFCFKGYRYGKNACGCVSRDGVLGFWSLPEGKKKEYEAENKTVLVYARVSDIAEPSPCYRGEAQVINYSKSATSGGAHVGRGWSGLVEPPYKARRSDKETTRRINPPFPYAIETSPRHFHAARM